MIQKHSHAAWTLMLILTIAVISGGSFARAGEVEMDKVTVAIAQTRCVDSDLGGNLERVSSMVAKAASEGAQMVFFPETADLGWVNPEAHRLAAPVPGEVTRRLGRMAAEHRVWIGAGVCERSGENLHDSAVLIDPSGEVVLLHRKINLLDWLMDPPYTPGGIGDIRSVDTPLGRVCMIICADSFEPEILEAVKQQRPDLVYIPYGWAAEKNEWPEHSFSLVRTVQRAARHIGAPVIGPNLVGKITHGPWKGRTFEGLSTAADGTGMSLVQGRWNREDLLVFELAPGNVHDVE